MSVPTQRAASKNNSTIKVKQVGSLHCSFGHLDLLCLSIGETLNKLFKRARSLIMQQFKTCTVKFKVTTIHFHVLLPSRSSLIYQFFGGSEIIFLILIDFVTMLIVNSLCNYTKVNDIILVI